MPRTTAEQREAVISGVTFEYLYYPEVPDDMGRRRGEDDCPGQAAYVEIEKVTTESGDDITDLIEALDCKTATTRLILERL